MEYSITDSNARGSTIAIKNYYSLLKPEQGRPIIYAFYLVNMHWQYYCS